MTEPDVASGTVPMVPISAELLLQLELVVTRQQLQLNGHQHPDAVDHLLGLADQCYALLAEHTGQWHEQRRQQIFGDDLRQENDR